MLLPMAVEKKMTYYEFIIDKQPKWILRLWINKTVINFKCSTEVVLSAR